MPDVGLLEPGLDDVADDLAIVRAMLRAEATWTDALAATGHVAAEDAVAVRTAAARLASLDDAAATALATTFRAGSASTGNPVLPLVAALRHAATSHREGAATAVHTGLTSQDVVDTALVLVVRDVARTALTRLDTAGEALATLARSHRDTPALARTLAQAAAPTTFGARAATWLHGVDAAAAALAAAVDAAPLAYGGAAGTLDAVPGDAFAIVDAWGASLGLRVPAAPWHVARAPMLRTAAALAEVVAACGTVAVDVLAATRPGVGELRERGDAGHGASSAMAFKHNPVRSVLLHRSALVAPHLLAQVALAGGLAVDERPDGAWHAEWAALRSLARHAVSSARLLAELLETLEVHADRLAANLDEHLRSIGASRLDVGHAAAIVDRVLARHEGMRS